MRRRKAECSVIFWLLVAHAVADYPLQSDWMAKAKNRHQPLGYVPAGQTPQAIWPWVLSAHAATHGGAVALATGSVELGIAEFVLHWLIDAAKCENLTGIHTDQMLHIACKVLWAVLIAYGVPQA